MSESTHSSRSGGIGFCGLLTVVLIAMLGGVVLIALIISAVVAAID